MTTYRKARFTTNDEQSFEGWTDGETWNGFACPRFERDEAEKLAASVEDTGAVAVYDPAADAVTITEYDGEELLEPETYEGFDIETPEGTKHVYAVGAWGWVWNEVDG